MNNKRATGNVGEEIACKYVAKQGFKVIKRNYLKKWGEIDIVAKKKGMLHFFEVKSTTLGDNAYGHRPEENVHDFKMARLSRTIQTYIAESGGGPETPFSFHVLSISMNEKTRLARVKWIKDVIL